jgi:hypothetical protein
MCCEAVYGREVISMKTLITIMTVAVLSFAVVAFADEPVFMAPPDTGTLIYEASLNKMPIEGEAKFVAERPLTDAGIALYESHLADRAESGARGVAAGGRGGVKVVDERTRIWDDLLVPTPSAE